jgi:hypothetical protein
LLFTQNGILKIILVKTLKRLSFHCLKEDNIFCIKDGIEPIVFTPLGYPKENYVKRKRKSLDELVVLK